MLEIARDFPVGEAEALFEVLSSYGICGVWQVELVSKWRWNAIDLQIIHTRLLGHLGVLGAYLLAPLTIQLGEKSPTDQICVFNSFSDSARSDSDECA